MSQQDLGIPNLSLDKRATRWAREAFDYFGGVREHLLFINTKAVIIERGAYGPRLYPWNDELKALA